MIGPRRAFFDGDVRIGSVRPLFLFCRPFGLPDVFEFMKSPWYGTGNVEDLKVVETGEHGRSKTLKCAFSDKDYVWVDATRDYVVVRTERTHRNSDELTIEYGDDTEYGPLPKHAVWVRSGKNDGVLHSKSVIEFRDIQFNVPLVDPVFDFPFPAGTEVLIFGKGFFYTDPQGQFIPLEKEEDNQPDT
jgi:hypothetical protein